MQELLEQQRKEYEGTIARHLQFVDRLLKDKDDLSTRCAALATDVKVRSLSTPSTPSLQLAGALVQAEVCDSSLKSPRQARR